MTDVQTKLHYDEVADRVIVQHTQDVEPYLDSNKALANDGKGMNADKSLKRIASIPVGVQLEWIQQDGIDFTTLPKHEMRTYLKRKLNSPEYRYLRTSSGRY